MSSAVISWEKKHPINIPKNNHIATLLVQHYLHSHRLYWMSLDHGLSVLVIPGEVFKKVSTGLSCLLVWKQEQSIWR